MLSPLAHCIGGACCSPLPGCSSQPLPCLCAELCKSCGRKESEGAGGADRAWVGGCSEPDGGRRGGGASNCTSGKHLANNLKCILTPPPPWLCLSAEGIGS